MTTLSSPPRPALAPTTTPAVRRSALHRLLPRQLMPPSDPKVAQLRCLGLFAGVPDRVLASVAPLVDRLDLPEGERLITEGAPAHEAFVLVDGTAQARLRGRLLGLAHPGELLGDLALLRSGYSPVTWIATTDVVLLAIGPRELREVLHRCPIVADRLHGCAEVPANTDQGRPVLR